MAITIEAAPAQLAPVRSPQWLYLYGSRWTNAPSYTAKWGITVNEALASGTALRIVTDLGAVTLTAQTTPNDGGTQFLAGTNLTNSTDRLLAGLLGNPFLTRHYRFTRIDANNIEAEARVPGSGSNFRQDDSSVNPGTRADMVSLQAGSSQLWPESYSIVVRVFVYHQGQWKMLPEEYGVPLANQRMEMPLSGVLEPYLKPDWPAVSTTGGLLRMTQAVMPYYVETWERYGDPPTDRLIARWGSDTAPKQAWLAGYQRAQYPSFAPFLARVLGVNPAPHPFLTWRNRKARRYVTMAEQHYLGWYHWPMQALAATLHLQACLTHTAPDGTDPQTTAWSDRLAITVATQLPRGEMAQFNVGYGQLALATLLPTGRVATSYSVRINEAQTGPKSEELTFHLTEGGYNDLYIQYVNSLGCVESLRTQGRWVESLETEHQLLQRPARFGDQQDSMANTLSSHPTGGQRTLQVSTGHHPLAEHKALLDILGAPRNGIALLDLATNRRLPLRLVKGTEHEVAKRGELDEHLYSLDLVFALDDPEQVITHTPTAAEMVHNEDDGFVYIEGEGESG